ncbi:MAG: topoisomerase DNA-binding C4 zinc finger domain-containing protein [Coriobacteriales bacterium]|jgi:DNA topoisomerase-1|nr:topoisomerase DNA-binding C4 zinc finger domain-containing protein [Coriobacteriales bacterium]
MQLIITEKNDAAKRIAELLADGTTKAEKVYETPVYRFVRDGQDCVTIGLRGHILGLDFVPTLSYTKRRGWFGIDQDGVIVEANVPDALDKPPFKKRKPFTEDTVELKSWKLNGLPYLVFAPVEKLPAEKGIIRSIKNLANKAESVIIATDFDREGELIGSDALAMVREANAEIPATRARYSSFTKQEILHAFDNLVELDTDLAQAGEARQWIDLIWGAVLTRYLTMAKQAGFGNVRPSGRVQTPTLALVVAKEREREAFVPEDYWVIKGNFDTDLEAAPPAQEPAKSTDANNAAAEKAPTSPTAFVATHATERFKDEAAAKAAMAAVQNAHTATVSSIEHKSRTVAPPTPFNTTSLQGAAASEGLSPARVMRIAESLYMAGYISYPRVDNTVYPSTLDLRETAAVLRGVPAYAPFVDDLLKKDKLTATRGKTETTDHPPIYPTAAANPDKLRADEWKLYNLIARRFLATLSTAATVEGTKVALDVAGEDFVAKGDVLVKPGFRAIYPYGLKKDDQLPRLEQGQTVAFFGATCTWKQTEPPSRYSQGRLIQEMEKAGLGTKSTRHSIIERLTEVRYIQNDPVEPTQLGIAVIDALGAFAPHITTPDMTAELEDEMSAIAAGTDKRDRVVFHSRTLLAEIMGELIPRKDEVGEALSEAITADARVGACPTCGKDLLLKSSAKTRSNFIGCSGWPDCDVTYPVPQGKIDATETMCPTCGKPQITIIQFRQKPLTRCVDPACPSNQEPDIPIGPCPACTASGADGLLVAQRSPRTLKRFMRCTNYAECGVSYPLPARGELEPAPAPCEACGAPKVIISTRRGPWEICPNLECPERLEKEAAAEKKAAEKAAGKTSTAKKPAKKSAAKKTTKKPAVKKTAAQEASQETNQETEKDNA